MTKEQQAIITQAKNMQSGEILKINACAGSGKTTTLIEIAKSMPHARFLYLAFNRAVAKEASEKFSKNVSVKTLHALAYSNVIAPKGYSVGGELKAYMLQEIFGASEKNSDKKWSDWGQILKEIKIYLNSRHIIPPPRIKPYIKQLYTLMKERQIAYTHAFYLKEYQFKKNKNLDIYDYILLDEAQDTNESTISIFLDNCCKKILVGDSNQNIYGFLNTINALHIIKAQYEMYLTNSFRTPQNILDKANYFLKKYGKLKHKMYSQSHFKDIKTKAILTRTNAKIIDYVMKEMKENSKNINILKNPDEIFECAIALLDFKQEQKIAANFAFLKKFTDLNDVRQYAKDVADIELLLACDTAKRYADNIYAGKEYARAHLYNNAACDTQVQTAHSAKGLEWDSVTIEGDFSNLSEIQSEINKLKALKSKRRADVEALKFWRDNLLQETNLYYVALTRARVVCKDLSQNNKEYADFIKK